MSFSRRKFMKWAAAASTFAVVSRSGAEVIAPFREDLDIGLRPTLLPSQKEVWDQVTWMAKLGPKFTGNKAHTQFVEFLATHLQGYGLEVGREHYTLPRWEARHCAI